MEQVKIEWNIDFDNSFRIELKKAFGREGPHRFKGRCRKCWGGLIGKSDPEGNTTAIRCRVCKILLEDSDAQEEFQGMEAEMSKHEFNIAFDQPTKYRESGKFVFKVFPNLDRLSDDELRQRIASKRTKRGWLDRSDFPPGSPGFLVLQAKTLMSALERLPREESVGRFPEIEMHDDGSVALYRSKEQLSEHPSTTEYELMKRLGSAMTVAMMSAFACELAMKAIRLTQYDDAQMSHDLWKLYQDLPAGCKKRVEKDYSDIQSIMKNSRHTFGKWRYFEFNIGDRALSAMIDTDRALALSKSARVLLDEAEIMGLSYSVKLRASQRATKIDDKHQHLHIKHDLYSNSTESPPR